MFTKILIANRGEIACRIAQTARRLGIQTVAVYSEADTHALHVQSCDEAVYIGQAAPQESYLSMEKIMSAALKTGAQAIHPGYGFLSENSTFAAKCEAAGLVFIGPPVGAIEAMGSKAAAKQLMEKAGVPLVPGYHGDNQTPDFLQAEADKIGYPVLLKASAGGGGKGMRVVAAPQDFLNALASCKREARNAFGDDHVLIEKYLLSPRHIEIQIFADHFGEMVYLFERDCSIQRRHQKVIEEAPAPGMTQARREAMGQAALAAAAAVHYVGAGTVEFIVDQSGAFYFMEMNTRLQVEHPVTEMITGMDLVEWQLRVAAKESLPRNQSELAFYGHAIEARIYAENPDQDFLPSIGQLIHYRPPILNEVGVVVRVDAAVVQGDTITPFYDPMIAKLIVWGKDREAARAHMHAALAQYHIVGVQNNIDFLKRIMVHPTFIAGKLDTGFIESQQASLFSAPAAPTFAELCFAVSHLILNEQSTNKSPWGLHNGWRMNSYLVREWIFTHAKERYTLSVSYKKKDWLIRALNQAAQVHARLDKQDTLRLDIRYIDSNHTDQSEEASLSHDVKQHTFYASVVKEGEAIHIFNSGQHTVLTYSDPLLHSVVADVPLGRLTAPMPGKIVAQLADLGQMVKEGEPLVIMEAMKMEHTIHAPTAGVVKEWMYQVGEQVTEGAQLLTLE